MTPPDSDSLAAPFAPLAIAYLVSQYPAPSHTFIEREVAGLRGLGHRVDTFSVRPTPDEFLLDDTMAAESGSTMVLLASRSRLARDVARTLSGRPASVLRAARQALGTGEPYARTRVKQLFYLAEAVTLHAELERRGLRHLHVHFANNGADVARLVVALGRAVDGQGAGWRWTMTVHGPTEFEAVAKVDLAAKVLDADAVACISDFARSQLMRLTPPASWAKLHRVNMSVDTERYRPSAPDAREGRAFRVLSVGRLVPEKGATVLVEALRQLRAAGHDVEAKLVGTGPHEAAVQQAITVAGLDRFVELTGALGQDRLPDLYRWCDVFCLPSFQEGLPVVLMEAMASARPVVTTAIAGIPELVSDGAHGRVVSAGRADLIAAAPDDLANATEDLEALGRSGRAAVEAGYSVAVAARQHELFLTAT